MAWKFLCRLSALLTAVEMLSASWPISLWTWRTANLVNARTGFWHRDANELIKRANAASTRAALKRDWSVFNFEAFPDSGTLRDAHHPVGAPLEAAVEFLLADARMAAALSL